MAGSWTKLNHDVWKHPLICADAEHFIVWWYLKTYAAFETYPAFFSGNAVTLTPGQLITGAAAIAEKTHVERTKVTRILRRFEAAGMIRQQITRAGRLVTVVEDTRPQGAPQSEEKRHSRTAPSKKESVYSSDASYDLEAYARTAIGLREE
ncbi:MAG: MarR family transcriptional regulator [Clostridia bacterium]|nr:MarR family transcriptional regulator [Clostridia bacterium]MBR3553882.1 MarR family transcriptional regulator [Clostridia bacterium]